MKGQGVPAALEAIGRALQKIDKPVIMVATCNKALNDITREAIAVSDLPHIITGIDPMLRAVGKAAWWSKQLDSAIKPLLLDEAPVAPAPLSSERAVLDYLSEAGVRVIPGKIATSRAEATAFAEAMDEPLVLKIASPDIVHKTEAGGVRLNVARADVPATFDAILADVARARPGAAIDGVILSPMRCNDGVELLVSVTRDPTWGPTIAVGMGGVMVEVMADVAIAPLPVDREEVLAMLRGLRGTKLLQGFRGAPAADMDAVADTIVRIGGAALRLGPSLASLEVNPLLVYRGDIEALDGLVIWNDGKAADARC